MPLLQSATVPETRDLHSQASKKEALKVIIYELLSPEQDMGGGNHIRT